jgi:hypothetical protein
VEELQNAAQAMQQMVAASQFVMQTDQILDWLGHAEQACAKDAEDYLRLSALLDAGPELALAEVVTSDKTFQDWFSSMKSQVLVVDAIGSASVISPGSYVVASLVQLLRSVPQALTIAHFCNGDGAKAVSADCGGDQIAAILASFICQLVSKRQYNLQWLVNSMLQLLLWDAC